MNFLSKRVQSIKPSPTLAVTALAAQLRSQGRDVIGLGSGEPDFDTPEHIKQAAKKALDQGLTKYTAVDGVVELKEAIQAKFKCDNHLDYKMDELMVSCGAKQIVYNLMQAVLDEGDEVIIPAPFWVSYPDMALLSGGKPVVITSGIENDFKINAEQLEKAITPKTKLLIINSPSNPTGSVYSPSELEALAQVLRQHPRILVASDDIYEHIKITDFEFSTLANFEDLKDRVLSINGVSKAFAMTGWRIGFVGGHHSIIQAMKKVQSQSTSNPTSISQYATIAALKGGYDCLVPMVEAFKQRHQFVHSALNAIDGIECSKAQGAFYAFPRAQGLIEKKGLKDDLELSAQLLDYGVAIVPGSAFGASGYFRLSFATSLNNLEKALDRITQFVQG